jgi:hypothetical protein
MVAEDTKGSEVSLMNEKITGKDSAHTPAVPEVLDDPMLNRGVGFTLAEREALGLAGRLPSGVLTLEQNLRASSATTAVAVARAAADDGVATTTPDDLVQAVQEAMWQPVYSSSMS